MIFFIVMFLGLLLFSGTALWAIHPGKKTKQIAGSKYDAHYTRELEVVGGLEPKTQCDNESCQKCYWKPRSIHKHQYLPTTGLKQKFDAWVEEQLDGLSDDLYELLWDDWYAQDWVQNAIRKAKEDDWYKNKYLPSRYRNRYPEPFSTSSESYKSKTDITDGRGNLITRKERQDYEFIQAKLKIAKENLNAAQRVGDVNESELLRIEAWAWSEKAKRFKDEMNFLNKELKASSIKTRTKYI